MTRNSQSGNKRIRQQAGYSLLEMMMLSVLAVIVLGASIPVIDSIYTAFKLRTSAEILVDELQMAKMMAVNNNASVSVLISSANSTFNISGQTTRYLDSTVTFSGTPPASITFTSRGRLSTAGTQTFTLQGRNSQTKTVTINTNGRIAIS